MYTYVVSYGLAQSGLQGHQLQIAVHADASCLLWSGADARLL